MSLVKKDQRARFEFRDTGIGIPLKDRERIFDRFCRGSNAQDSNSQGYGLGLSLAAWIAERHKTSIIVESELGSGSSFSWDLNLTPKLQLDASPVTALIDGESSPLLST